MTSTNGADLPAAIREFRAAGWSVRDIAADLGVHPSTIYRWGNGTRTPRHANFAALVELVDARYSQQVHRRQLTVASLHLRQAAEALVTGEQRAREQALADRMAADFAERERRDAAEQDERDAAARQRRDDAQALAARTRSITGQVDPFLVCQTAPQREVAMFG